MIWIGKNCYRPSCSTPVLKQDHLEQVVPDRQKNLVPRFFWRSPRTLWPFIRVSPVAPYLSRAREPQTGHCSRLGFTSAEQRSLLTCWQCFVWCKPGYHQHSLQQGHNSGLCSATCPPGTPGLQSPLVSPQHFLC